MKGFYNIFGFLKMKLDNNKKGYYDNFTSWSTKLVILLQWGLTTTAEIPQPISLQDQWCSNRTAHLIPPVDSAPWRKKGNHRYRIRQFFCHFIILGSKQGAECPVNSSFGIPERSTFNTESNQKKCIGWIDYATDLFMYFV